MDDGIDELETIMRKVVERREELRALAPNTRGEGESSIDLSIRYVGGYCPPNFRGRGIYKLSLFVQKVFSQGLFPK